MRGGLQHNRFLAHLAHPANWTRFLIDLNDGAVVEERMHDTRYTAAEFASQAEACHIAQ